MAPCSSVQIPGLSYGLLHGLSHVVAPPVVGPQVISMGCDQGAPSVVGHFLRNGPLILDRLISEPMDTSLGSPKQDGHFGSSFDVFIVRGRHLK